jgi:hypothetical protein
MKKINQYAEKSSLMKVTVKQGEETFEFNLFEELQINESIISKELKNQPTSYAFLTMLQIQTSALYQKAKANEERVHNKLYLRYKKKRSEQTGRPNSDDVAKAMVTGNEVYTIAQNKTIALAKQLGTISNCVKAFEQRSSLLQTLSANRRKELL